MIEEELIQQGFSKLLLERVLKQQLDKRKERQATLDKQFSANDITGSLGVWGINQQ